MELVTKIALLHRGGLIASWCLGHFTHNPGKLSFCVRESSRMFKRLWGGLWDRKRSQLPLDSLPFPTKPMLRSHLWFFPWCNECLEILSDMCGKWRSTCTWLLRLLCSWSHDSRLSSEPIPPHTIQASATVLSARLWSQSPCNSLHRPAVFFFCWTLGHLSKKKKKKTRQKALEKTVKFGRLCLNVCG